MDSWYYTNKTFPWYVSFNHVLWRELTYHHWLSVTVISLRTADVHQSGQISKKATAKMLTLATNAKSGGKCSTVPFFSSLSWARMFEKPTFHPFCETHNLQQSWWPWWSLRKIGQHFSTRPEKGHLKKQQNSFLGHHGSCNVPWLLPPRTMTLTFRGCPSLNSWLQSFMVLRPLGRFRWGWYDWLVKVQATSAWEWSRGW